MDRLKKIGTFSFVSLDGFVAKMDGDISWVSDYPNPEEYDYGYNNFFKSVNYIIFNEIFYNILQSYDRWPFENKTCHVVTRQRVKHPKGGSIRVIIPRLADGTTFVDRIKLLQQETNGDIWLAGDHEIITLLLEQDMVDEMTMTIFPVTLGNGLPLFNRNGMERHWVCQNFKQYKNGVVQVKYTVNR